MPELAEWDSFYLIVGSAAAALIGLQFIFMTLLANSRQRPGRDAGAAFGTPTIVLFCVVLFAAALLRAPWKSVAPVAALCAITGLTGVGYILLVARRMREQKVYEPETDDWMFYALLPGVAYLILAVSGFAAFWQRIWPWFGVGASELMLLFSGIRNSWDSASYHVLSKNAERKPRTSTEKKRGNLGDGT